MKCLRWFLVLTVLFIGLVPVSSAMLTDESPMPEEEKEIPWYDYDLSEYVTLGDLTAVQASYPEVGVCTEKEIDNAVFQLLLARADFQEKSTPAERYHKVEIDFSIALDGVLQEEYSQTDYPIVIGLETGNAVETVLGEALMGSQIGQVRTAPYTYPEGEEAGKLAGKTVELRALVKRIEHPIIPELIDATVPALFGEELTSVAALRESVRQTILQEKDLARARAVWGVILQECTVRRYPKREVEAYRELFLTRYRTMAKEYGLTLEELVTVYLEEEMDAFYRRGEESAREKVKNDMIFTQLVRLQGITLTEEEYREGLLLYYEKEKEDFASLEEYEQSYTRESLWRSVLWDKALKAVVDRSVRVS